MLQCRHHHTYVRKLKEALKKAPELAEMDLNKLMQAVGTVSIWHPEVDQDVRNHGGGAAPVCCSGIKCCQTLSCANAGESMVPIRVFRATLYNVLPAFK